MRFIDDMIKSIPLEEMTGGTNMNIVRLSSDRGIVIMVHDFVKFLTYGRVWRLFAGIL